MFFVNAAVPRRRIFLIKASTGGVRSKADRNRSLNYRFDGDLAITRIEQNHFIVYDSNAAELGMIDDQDLLREIVAVYGVAKSLVDTLNTSARDFDRWRQVSDQSQRKAVTRQYGLGTRAGTLQWFGNPSERSRRGT